MRERDGWMQKKILRSANVIEMNKFRDRDAFAEQFE